MKILVDDVNLQSNNQIIFIHGRPGPHPLHGKFAKSVNAKFQFVDPVLRWHDKQRGKFYRYLSYLFSALFLKVKKDTIILSQGIHFMPFLAKVIRISKRIKLIYLLDDEGLFFIRSRYYSSITRHFAILALKNADGLICVGEFQSGLSREILKEREPIKQVTFNGISKSRLDQLEKNSPNLLTKNILFIGNGPDSWRIWYKGLDLMIEAFGELFESFPDSTFTIVGDWNKVAQEHLLRVLRPRARDKVFFTGKVDNLDSIIKDKSIYLHVARGEAWGIAITEAMAAGIPAIVSDVTGAAEVVKKVSEELIISPSLEGIVNKLIWYFKLNPNERVQFSVKSKLEALKYTEEKSILHFKQNFDALNTKIDEERASKD